MGRIIKFLVKVYLYDRDSRFFGMEKASKREGSAICLRAEELIELRLHESGH
jgi:hypothetical protein